MSARRIQELVDEYLNGNESWMYVVEGIVDTLLDGDIDAQLAELPPETRDSITWTLKDRYAATIGRDPADYSIVESVCLQPGCEKEYRADLARREERLRTVEIPKLQAWLGAHPLPPRDPFPIALVRDLFRRLDLELQDLQAQRPRGVGHRKAREREVDKGVPNLRAVVSALATALDRAELAGAGSQEQALAWEGFDRVAHLIAARQDLGAAEKAVVDAGASRRNAAASAIGRSPPGTRGVLSKP